MADGFGNVRFENWNESEFTRIRKAPALESKFHEMGFDWAERLNAEVHSAQEARKQPVADGYDYHVRDEGTRIRLYVVASTARGQAHEAKHHSMLKLMRTGELDVKVRKPDKPENPRTHLFGAVDKGVVKARERKAKKAAAAEKRKATAKQKRLEKKQAAEAAKATGDGNTR